MKSNNINLNDYLEDWTAAIFTGQYDLALEIEFKAYEDLIKKEESVENWDLWQSKTSIVRTSLTNFYCELFPSGNHAGNGKLAVVLPNFSGLAHEAQFGRRIKNSLKLNSDLSVTIIYARGDPLHDHIRTASEIYGLNQNQIIFLKANRFIEAAIKLDNYLNFMNIGTVIYPSIYYFCFWMSLFCRHGNQKFFQMKYYPRQIGRIKQWAGGFDGSTTGKRIVNGESFMTLPLDLNGLEHFNFTSSNHENQKLYIGSISRIEKIQNSKYIDTICDLLKKYPHIEYLITGRINDDKKIPENLINSKQIKFVGWVEPKNFLSAIDIYIDTWPFGGGDMSFLALTNGIPYITMQTSEGLRAGPLPTIKYIASSSPYSTVLNRYLPESEENFFKEIDYLVQSKFNRQKIGNLWKLALSKTNFAMDDVWNEFLFN